MSKRISLLLPLVALLAACTPKQPAEYKETGTEATVYPDYTNVTVPRNIAPLHFRIEAEADGYVTVMKARGEELVKEGREVRPSEKEWRRLTEKGDIEVRVFTKKDGRWEAFRPFAIRVSPDAIDPWISYRLISPSYVAYENLTLQQRCLENYEERLIYGNMINSPEEDGQCINCHFTQGGNPERMQFHVRQGMGGTVIACDGKLEKVDLKVDGAVSGGVYPAWHPTEKLIAYSTNKTGQSFHTTHLNKIEVQDTYSDLVLYDPEENKIHELERDSDRLDCFPAWSPDGKWLYYCSARYEHRDTSLVRDEDIIRHFRQLRYNLCRRSFNVKARTFGPEELVYDAESDSLSATE
ncbi:MAG: PD40 domain-containing protein, partial [Bacteroidaceae bacterium]|nr:PD40 domain-containing protein [Bacteroidaceae bacterium]